MNIRLKRTPRSLTTRLVLLITLVMGLMTPFTGVAHASSAATGVYTGPGTVSAHNNFSTWLGAQVPYTTDYVDYKGGWQKDFIDSKVWLLDNWSTWVKAAPGRRLVLGLPMLENSNAGQFDAGASGAFDTYFRVLAQNMVSGGLGNSIIRLGYEANCQEIGPWQATDNPNGYVSLFRHIVSTMRATAGSSFSFDWTLCNGYENGHALTSFDSFYPGDDVVDIVGMDVYDVKWMDTSVTAAQRWQYNVTRYMGMQDHKNFAAAHGKPVSFPEWGLYKAGDAFAGGGDDPYFIDQMADWMSGSNTVYQSYFNLNWGGGVLSDFPSGQAEYKVRFGQAATQSDTTSPSVSLTSPGSGAIVAGTVTVTASSSDNVGVTKVEQYVDGALKATATSYSWNTSTVSNGSHTLSAKAYDAAGNTKSSSPVTVTVSNAVSSNDTTAPVVSLYNPVDGSTINTKFPIDASATDNTAVTKMEVYIDGVLKKTVGGGTLSFTGTAKATGSHTITVKAYDAAGNIGQYTVVVRR